MVIFTIAAEINGVRVKFRSSKLKFANMLVEILL